MFRHHKFCVIEVSGHLRGHQDSQGRIHLWLIDTTESLTNSAATQGQQIRIVDADFCSHVGQHVSPTSAGQYLLTARITGNVNMDGGETTLGDISQATLHSGDTVLVYDPQRLG